MHRNNQKANKARVLGELLAFRALGVLGELGKVRDFGVLGGLRVLRALGAIAFVLLCVQCTNDKEASSPSPFDKAKANSSAALDLPDIQANGELIVLTTYGAGSYFEFRGEPFGIQYMLAAEYAKSIGTSIRVDVSRSEAELVRKLQDGEGDIIAYNIGVADSLTGTLAYCGEKEISEFIDSIGKQRKDKSITTGGRRTAWAVRSDATELSASLNAWMSRHSADFWDYTTIKVRSSSGKVYTPRRVVRAPILDAACGRISVYDDLFKRYAATCQWDWRLIAAQAYQESAFDPQAVSFMGAMGLMQLMPTTARNLGVAQSRVFEPEENIKGAAKLINQLNDHYSVIANLDERINFILAAYNAGPGHVDDARALARKHGKNPNVWLGNVDVFVLNMSKSEYFNQPEVKHGYFRGSETHDYVNSIRARWQEYRNKIR